MDELVEVVAATEDVDGAAAPHELEEDLEDAQAVIPEDRARPDDGDVETERHVRGGDTLAAELGCAVGLARTRLDRRVDRVLRGNTEDGARGDEHGFLHVLRQGSLKHVPDAVDVHRLEEGGVLREGNLGHAVEDAVHPLADTHDGRRIADVAVYEAQVDRAVARVREIEDGDLVASPPERLDEDAAEIARTARDERAARHYSSTPFARHHSIERRIPSSSSISGS